MSCSRNFPWGAIKQLSSMLSLFVWFGLGKSSRCNYVLIVFVCSNYVLGYICVRTFRVCCEFRMLFVEAFIAVISLLAFKTCEKLSVTWRGWKVEVFTFVRLLRVTCLVFCCSQQCSSFVKVQMLLCQSASKFLYFIFLGGALWQTTLTRRWRLRELRLTRRRRWQVCSFTSLLLLFFLRFSFSRFLWRCLTLLVLCLGLLRFVRLVEAVVKKVVAD